MGSRRDDANYRRGHCTGASLILCATGVAARLQGFRAVQTGCGNYRQHSQQNARGPPGSVCGLSSGATRRMLKGYAAKACGDFDELAYRLPRFGLAGSGSIGTTAAGACSAPANDCFRASSLPANPPIICEPVQGFRRRCDWKFAHNIPVARS